MTVEINTLIRWKSEDRCFYQRQYIGLHFWHRWTNQYTR